MVLTVPPRGPAPGELAFGGANGRQFGNTWSGRARQTQPGAAAAARAGSAGSPYAKGAGRKKGKGKTDSWGTRPIDLFWNEQHAVDERAVSPGSARESVEVAGNWSNSLGAPEEAIRQAAMRLESSTGKGLSLRGALPTLADGRAASAPPEQQQRSPQPPTRFLSGPALEAQSAAGIDEASMRRSAAMMNLPWRELPVSAASYPAHGMKLKKAASKKPGKESKAKRKKALPQKTMEWLATRRRMQAAEGVQPALDKILRGEPPPPGPPKPKKKKRGLSRAAKVRKKARALKKQQGFEMQHAINGGVDLEVKRWKDAEKVRGKEMVTEEKFNAWHAKWADGSLPSESEWNAFFMADVDGDGVLQVAELSHFAERKERGVSAEKKLFWQTVIKVGTRVRVKGALGEVIIGPDQDNDVGVRWDHDDTQTFVKKIELRYEDMSPETAEHAVTNHFFYQPDSELEFIQLNHVELARRAVADLEAAHAAQLAEAERRRLEAEAAEAEALEEHPSDDEEAEFSRYVSSVQHTSQADLAGWAPMQEAASPRTLEGMVHDSDDGGYTSWRASLARNGGEPAKRRRPGPGASFELSLSYATVGQDHASTQAIRTTP